MLLTGLALAAEPDDSAAPATFDRYELVWLTRGPSWSSEVTDEVRALQERHLAHLSAMAEAGHLVVAGPLSDQPDPSVRGICLYRTGSLDEARALAESDPAVQAGRLSVEVMTWWTEAGAMAFPLATDRAPAHAHGGHHHHGHDATVSHRFDDPERWAAVFDDPARDAWQKPAALVAALRVEKGSTVADIGAGTGYLLPHLARAVGKKGTVLAVDVEPSLVLHMAKRALSERLLQVEPRLGAPDDPGLTDAEADLVVLVNTYHHIDDRLGYFGRLRRAMRPGGRLAIVDFVADREPPVGPPPEMRISGEQVEAELGEVGWRLVDSPDVLPHQYVRVFEVAP